MILLINIFCVWGIGVLVALIITMRRAFKEEPMISRSDANFASLLCLMSWPWVVYLLTEK